MGILAFPFEGLNAWAGITFFGTITGVGMLFVLKYFSDQDEILKWKEKIIGYILEIRLFNSDLINIFFAQFKIFSAVIRYTATMLKPIFLALIPIILLLIQLNLHYGYQPLEQGQKIIISVTFNSASDVNDNWKLETPDGIKIETPVLRIEEKKQIKWRLNTQDSGIYNIIISNGEESVDKKIVVDYKSVISPVRTGKGIISSFFNPGEKNIISEKINEIKIEYIDNELLLFNWKFHWIYGFMLITLVSGYFFKSFVKVEF